MKCQGEGSNDRQQNIYGMAGVTQAKVAVSPTEKQMPEWNGEQKVSQSRPGRMVEGRIVEVVVEPECR